MGTIFFHLGLGVIHNSNNSNNYIVGDILVQDWVSALTFNLCSDKSIKSVDPKGDGCLYIYIFLQVRQNSNIHYWWFWFGGSFGIDHSLSHLWVTITSALRSSGSCVRPCVATGFYLSNSCRSLPWSIIYRLARSSHLFMYFSVFATYEVFFFFF